MKHLKTLALAAVAAGALMAFVGAGSASATVLCYTTTDPCPEAEKLPVGTNLHFGLTTEVTWRETTEPGEGEVLDTCTGSTLQAQIEGSGSLTTTVLAPVTEWTLKSCATPAAITQQGRFEIHKITGTSNGTVTANKEMRVTIDPLFFGSCVYALSSGQSLGEITEGKPAILHLNAVIHKIEGTGLFCRETVRWTATYAVLFPENKTLSISNG